MSEHVTYHISRITSEHSDWLRSIEFYQQELEILKKRLAEVSAKYTNQDVKAEVEHFQNQFIVQRNNLDELHHSIGEHVKHLKQDAAAMGQHLSNVTLAEHDVRREDLEILEKVINNLRHEFNRFLSRYM